MNRAALPVCSHTLAQATIAWQAGREISLARFVTDIRALAARLPDQVWVINACTDRYRFAVTLAAALQRGQVSLLPHNLLPATLAELAHRYPGIYRLHDDASAEGTDEPRGIASFRYPDDLAKMPVIQPVTVPAFPADQIAAVLFTSGTTGESGAHTRRWGTIVDSARAEVQRLGLSPERPMAVLGTVPAQHSYGFESTVFLPLHGGGAIVAERPFFPADVAGALHALPRPRMLVTTPVHLRACLGTGTPMPAADLVLSATSMLPDEMAAQAEAAFDAPLLEIYGSTETGQVASRRTVDGPRWWALDGITIGTDAEGAWAEGGYVGPRTGLADVIESHDATHFELRGRSVDMVNIAGKRSSIVHLERQLLSIEGVVDAALLFTGDEGHHQPARLIGFAVAPTLERAELVARLRRLIEPAFMPRPLYKVDGLPRDATGKLPRARLVQLAEQLSASRPRPARGGS